MVSLLSFLVFFALASAMTFAFRLWGDAFARWKLAQVARRTRVIFLDGARNIGDYKGTGFLSADREVGVAYGGTNASGDIVDGRLDYHYPALNKTNEMARMWLGDNQFFGSTNLMTPYYTHHAYTRVGTNDLGEDYYFEEEYGSASNRVRGDTIWFADFSVHSSDMPTNLYVRSMFPESEVAAVGGGITDDNFDAFYFTLQYELVYFFAGREYEHPEHISVRMVNVHY